MSRAFVAILVLLAACGAPPASERAPASSPSTLLSAPEAASPTQEPASPTAGLWVPATEETIGQTVDWTNKVELADITGDGLVDALFANGGNYESPGEPVPSRVFVNTAPGSPFRDATAEVFGDLRMLARVIKARDINADGIVDILVGTTFSTQSQLLLGRGDGAFENVTASSFPDMPLSVGDLEVGDVDGDGDLDVILADWGEGSPMQNAGGRVRLWANDGSGLFSDVTDARMPSTLVGFSWDLELIDVDNDWDLDIATSCKVCDTSLLYMNDGAGRFADETSARMPAFGNNYEFEPIDIEADGDLDLVTINDGLELAEHLFANDGAGRFTDATDELWPVAANAGEDDNVVVVLDMESDGDADFVVGSLSGADRLLVNDGSGHLTLVTDAFAAPHSAGTLGMAAADLDADGRLDFVEAQGENPEAEDERVYLGSAIAPDDAPPVIATDLGPAVAGAVTIHARVHDNAGPNTHAVRSVELRWTDESGAASRAPMQWYGEHLWRLAVELPSTSGAVQLCAIDAADNESCFAPQAAPAAAAARLIRRGRAGARRGARRGREAAAGRDRARAPR